MEAGAETVVGAVLTCVAFAAVLAPWVVRNERVMDAPVLTRDNFGVELYESSLESERWIAVGDGDAAVGRGIRCSSSMSGWVRLKFAQMRGEQARREFEGSAGQVCEVDAGPVSVFLGWDAACCEWAFGE